MSVDAPPNPTRWHAKGRDGHWVLQMPPASRRVETISSLADLDRRPHIPRSVVGFWRLLAFCVTCGETIRDLAPHAKDDIRHILVPDFWRRSPA